MLGPILTIAGALVLVLLGLLAVLMIIGMSGIGKDSAGSSDQTGGGGSTADCEKPSGTPKEIIDDVALAVAHEIAFDDITPESVEAANAAHSDLTTSGNPSDHKGPPERAWAADISNGGSPTPEMDQLAEDLAKCFGIPWNGSGLVNHTAGGYRYQLIYRTDEGGNHFNHVHIGVGAV